MSVVTLKSFTRGTQFLDGRWMHMQDMMAMRNDTTDTVQSTEISKEARRLRLLTEDKARRSRLGPHL